MCTGLHEAEQADLRLSLEVNCGTYYIVYWKCELYVMIYE